VRHACTVERLVWEGVAGQSPADGSRGFATEEETVSADVDMLRRWFAISDEVVDEFLHAYGSRARELIYNKSEGPIGLTPLWLMTHTMTHEFHHKGQIVTLARRLGYAPPDTDLVYPDNE